MLKGKHSSKVNESEKTDISMTFKLDCNWLRNKNVTCIGKLCFDDDP